jgi:antitoxin MazE
MKTHIVRIGNSQGVRIPKPLLEQTGLQGVVEMTVENGSLVIRPVKKPRDGWASAFQAMAKHGDDTLLDKAAPTLSAWDGDEWEWR